MSEVSKSPNEHSVLGASIRSLRLGLNENSTQFADRLEISIAMASRIQSGQRSPSPALMAKLVEHGLDIEAVAATEAQIEQRSATAELAGRAGLTAAVTETVQLATDTSGAFQTATLNHLYGTDTASAIEAVIQSEPGVDHLSLVREGIALAIQRRAENPVFQAALTQQLVGTQFDAGNSSTD